LPDVVNNTKAKAVRSLKLRKITNSCKYESLQAWGGKGLAPTSLYSNEEKERKIDRYNSR